MVLNNASIGCLHFTLCLLILHIVAPVRKNVNKPTHPPSFLPLPEKKSTNGSKRESLTTPMLGFQRRSWEHFWISFYKPELMSGFISRLCLLQVVSPVTPCVSQSFHISHYFILWVTNAWISLHFSSKSLEQRAMEYHVIPIICVWHLKVSNQGIFCIWVKCGTKGRRVAQKYWFMDILGLVRVKRGRDAGTRLGWKVNGWRTSNGWPVSFWPFLLIL